MEQLEQAAIQLKTALKELLAVAGLKKDRILVVGMSTSEVLGQKIGTASSLEVARALYRPLEAACKESGLFLAVQACEHLNRALVVEEECAEKYNLEQVTVVPAPKAGGSMATVAYQNFSRPVMVESIEAHAGLDLGDTLIGMHLKPVAVPVRSGVKAVGLAHLTMARTRPKLIGGQRAIYDVSALSSACR